MAYYPHLGEPAMPVAIQAPSQQKPVDWPVNWGRALKWHRGPNRLARRSAALDKAAAWRAQRTRHDENRYNQWCTKQAQRLARRA